MGWASGSEIMSELIDVVFNRVESDWVRQKLYADMIVVFDGHDCDTLMEATGKDVAYDKAYAQWRRENGLPNEDDE